MGKIRSTSRYFLYFLVAVIVISSIFTYNKFFIPQRLISSEINNDSDYINIEFDIIGKDSLESDKFQFLNVIDTVECVNFVKLRIRFKNSNHLCGFYSADDDFTSLFPLGKSIPKKIYMIDTLETDWINLNNNGINNFFIVIKRDKPSKIIDTYRDYTKANPSHKNKLVKLLSSMLNKHCLASRIDKPKEIGTVFRCLNLHMDNYNFSHHYSDIDSIYIKISLMEKNNSDK